MFLDGDEGAMPQEDHAGDMAAPMNDGMTAPAADGAEEESHEDAATPSEPAA